MNNRTSGCLSAAPLARVLAASATVAVSWIAASALPASAAEGLGTKEPSGLSAAQTVGLFVGIPALVFAAVIALVYGLSRNSEPRLREGQSWWTEPDYNTRESIGVQGTEAADADEAPRTTDGGGTGAGW